MTTHPHTMRTDLTENLILGIGKLMTGRKRKSETLAVIVDRDHPFSWYRNEKN